MEAFLWHIFICTQEKPADIPSCTASGSQEVLKRLQQEIAARGLTDEVQVTPCGSIGLCEMAPNLIVYPSASSGQAPEGTWYSRVQPDDVPELVQKHLIEGQIVERLAWTDEEALRRTVRETREKMMKLMQAR